MGARPPGAVGYGEDAEALAARGHAVVAVELTPELRRIGQHLHADTAIEWVDAALPALTGVRGVLNTALSSAVWTHLDERERIGAVRRVTELVVPGGCVAMPLRHGKIPQMTGVRGSRGRNRRLDRTVCSGGGTP